MKLFISSLVIAILATISYHDAHVNAYKVLGIFHTISKSHYIVGNALMKGLAEAGHEVTIISPFREKNPPKNYKEIYLDGLEEASRQAMSTLNFLDMNHMRYWENSMMLCFMGVAWTNSTLTNPAFRKFITAQPKPKFDVVVVEIFVSEPLIALGHFFDAPVIGMGTFGAYKWNTDLVGTPNIPSYIPNTFLGFTDRMTFWQRTQNSLAAWFDDIFAAIFYHPKQSALYDEHFGGVGKPTLADLKRNVSLVLLNNHVSLGYPRPYAPNMIDVGGMHIKQHVDKLPTNLQTYLDGAKSGAIYFSMGSNIKSTMFPPGVLKELFQVFAKLKDVKILFKGEPEDAPELQKIAKNALIQSWFPQEAILSHPNIKLFITHGGLLSTTESVYFGVPVIGIPIFGDQSLNMVNAENGGYGIKIDLPKLNGESLRNAIQKIFSEPRYSIQAKAVQYRLKDQIKTPLETAIYWVEYVVRHKGCPHLRSSVIDLPFYKEYNIDVWLALVLTIMVPILFIRKLIGRLFKKNVAKSQSKTKTN